MVAFKPEVAITQCTKETGRRFRRLRLGFPGRRDQRNIDRQRIMFACYKIQHGELSTSGLAAAIFDFRLSVMSDIIHNSPIEFLDHENVGISVEIAFLSSLQAEL